MKLTLLILGFFLVTTNAFAVRCELNVLDLKTSESKTFSPDTEKEFALTFNPTDFRCTLKPGERNEKDKVFAQILSCSIPDTGISSGTSIALVEGLSYDSGSLTLFDSKGKAVHLLLSCKR